MGREVRRVPAGWVHPVDEEGRCEPLLEGPFSERLQEWEEAKQKWQEGFTTDFRGGWKPKSCELEDMSFEDWNGTRPIKECYMPEWPESERTHWQMYETTTEGTPISPVMPTPESLARWLADTRASAFGSCTATYEQWLATIKRGWAPSAAISGGKLESGVAALV